MLSAASQSFVLSMLLSSLSSLSPSLSLSFSLFWVFLFFEQFLSLDLSEWGIQDLIFIYEFGLNWLMVFFVCVFDEFLTRDLIISSFFCFLIFFFKNLIKGRRVVKPLFYYFLFKVCHDFCSTVWTKSWEEIRFDKAGMVSNFC